MFEPVILRRLICQLPGGTRSVLVEDENRNLYTLKYPVNPQGPNVLANEWLAYNLLSVLGLPTNRMFKVTIPPFLNDGRRGVLGLLRDFVQPTNRRRLYEVLPRHLHGKVTNPDQILGTFVFDIWTGSTDRRQALYVEQARGWFEAVAIDHGQLFGGPSWAFDGQSGSVLCPQEALAGRKSVDSSVACWIYRIRSKLLNMLPAVSTDLPKEWYRGDIRRLQDALIRRAADLEKLVGEECNLARDHYQSQLKRTYICERLLISGIEAFAPQQT